MLSKRSQKGKYCIISLTCRILKQQQPKNQVYKHIENRLVVEVHGMGIDEGVKRYKVPVIKYVSHGNVICIMVTIVNNFIFNM